MVPQTLKVPNKVPNGTKINVKIEEKDKKAKVTLQVKVPRYQIHTFDIALRNGYAYIPTGIEVIMKY